MDLTLNELRTESRTSSRFSGKRVHFIGIGGCGMSGLARMLLDGGAIVTGSEPTPNPQTFQLTGQGAKISRDQLGELLTSQTELVVRTAAVPDTNRELIAAHAIGIPSIKYADLLGQVMAERFGIAVAGTHGKSTTTAMIAYAMLQCGADPSFVVGGTVPQLGGGSRSGLGKAFVAEACEFDRSFHKLQPRVAVITNIEEDHLDCYKNIDDIVASFKEFAKLVPTDGLILANGQDGRVLQALSGLKIPMELVALVQGFAWSTEQSGLANGCYTGQVSYKGKAVAQLALSVPGLHNLFNATVAVAACASYGINPEKAACAVNGFAGVDRRMMEVGWVNGTVDGARVVDDYGHHPTEIRATLKAIREKYHPSRLFCIFQPHQHSRTRFLLEDFATSFSEADETIVPDIYFVRDSQAERQRVSSSDLVDRIQAAGQKATHLSDFSAIVRYLKEQARPGDLMVTMGAGNVWEIGRDLAGG
jgi:UDP-N-acetylmuramate--alanine ligase